MLDAIVGAVIMVVATTSLLYSIEVAERAFDQSGQYPLNESEREALLHVDLVGSDAADLFLQEIIKEAPKAVEIDE